MLKFWAFCFVLMFGLAEAYQWVTQIAWIGEFTPSLPMVIALGILLAIASNIQHLSRSAHLPDSSNSPHAEDNLVTSPADTTLNISKQPSQLSFQIKPYQQQSTPSISFEITQGNAELEDMETYPSGYRDKT